MSQTLILVDFLSSTCWEKIKKEREASGAFFPGPEECCTGFLWLLVVYLCVNLRTHVSFLPIEKLAINGHWNIK
jgi:hypothetical protein